MPTQGRLPNKVSGGSEPSDSREDKGKCPEKQLRIVLCQALVQLQESGELRATIEGKGGERDPSGPLVRPPAPAPH